MSDNISAMDVAAAVLIVIKRRRRRREQRSCIACGVGRGLLIVQPIEEWGIYWKWIDACRLHWFPWVSADAARDLQWTI